MPINTRNQTLIEGIVANQRVSSGYIFYGPLGANLEAALFYFADRLQCTESAGNLFVCRSEKSIGIDQIRQVQESVKFGAVSGHYLVVIIPECDRLTTEAANAFLKTLEEPLPGVCFLLSTHHLFRVLPTVRSRCQLLDFPVETEIVSDSSLLSFPDLLALSEMDRFILSETLSQDKTQIDAHLRSWIQYAIDNPDALRPRDFEAVKMMIEILLQLQYNLNQRLQLDALLARLS